MKTSRYDVFSFKKIKQKREFLNTANEIHAFEVSSSIGKWRKGNDTMRVDEGAEIQLFVLDGCLCCICKIEGAMARGVN